MERNYYQIQSVEELKSLCPEELRTLCESIRQDIIQNTAVNGGHIGASLCCVEMIVALHKVFNTPHDSFVFDVGHQAYAHKMLTGRRDQMYKLRKENGLSGFTNRAESVHDAFGAGHASTSISSALGILEGKRLRGDDSHVVAVVGDGALTGGLTFEGLNHAGTLKRNLIVVVNDNRMSIDPNVGALKDAFEQGRSRDYFTLLGMDYWGPTSGHDLTSLIEMFQKAKRHGKPLVIHLLTEKGSGYTPAIKDKIRFHGCGPFDVESGNAILSPDAKKKYQDLFSETLIEMAHHDERMVAITAAMPSGTSLNKFAKVHPEKFYDVGLAEGHAVEFAAGLATQGVRPFVCIYSTFLQRAYDQLIHDVALQNLPVRICMDRAGLVGDDGATHQGVFDYAYLAAIPNFVVMAPKDESELQMMMETARQYDSGPIALRFPRGETHGLALPKKITPIEVGRAELLHGRNSGDALICAIGEPVWTAVEAAKTLDELHGLKISVLNLRFAKPLDHEQILALVKNFRSIVTVEEGVIRGGVGASILELFSEVGLSIPTAVLGVPDRFIEHASQKRQREICGIDKQAILQAVLDHMRHLEDTHHSYLAGNVTPLRPKSVGL